MSKKDIGPIALFVLALAAWALVDRFYVAKKLPAPQPPAIQTNEVGTGTASGIGPAGTNASTAAVEAATTNAAVATAPVADATPTQKFELKNDDLVLHLTSRGAAIESVTLPKYPKALKGDTGPVELDFSNQTALAYGGLGGLSDAYNFLVVEQTAKSVTLERQGENGLTLRRTITIGSNYVVTVNDQFSNRGSAAVVLGSHTLRTGSMTAEAGHHNMIGFSVMGVDTLSGGSDGVRYWGSDLSKWFGKIQATKGLPKLPQSIETVPLDDKLSEKSVDWIAAKNKYFVQIIAPQDGADSSLIQARRVVPPYELVDPNGPGPKDAEVETVGGMLKFASAPTIEPGKSIARPIEYYVGPKKFEELHGLRRHQVDVMEFGYWRVVGKILLQIMNFIYVHVIHNYGIAIMLLTVIVRTVFWPLTHKSTMSMKRMTKLQPLITELREKYKGNPQKMQVEMMALYKEHKVNPVAGCLPMIIQIPIFIALFSVLRSAIELRYASFLWIRDLSEPERLIEFGFALPLIGWDALNILPLAMAGTMWLQMKVTPTAGDPQQQKIMMIMMPIMMVFMLYNYASGLALYWTTTNIISIGQQFYYRRLSKNDPPLVAATPAPGRKKK